MIGESVANWRRKVIGIRSNKLENSRNQKNLINEFGNFEKKTDRERQKEIDRQRDKEIKESV
jgi:hypothetical protein